MSCVLHLEALESHYRLNANRIKDLLQPPNPDGLVGRLLVWQQRRREVEAIVARLVSRIPA
jgi:hypothetical protein